MTPGKPGRGFQPLPPDCALPPPSSFLPRTQWQRCLWGLLLRELQPNDSIQSPLSSDPLWGVLPIFSLPTTPRRARPKGSVSGGEEDGRAEATCPFLLALLLNFCLPHPLRLFYSSHGSRGTNKEAIPVP